MLAQAQSPDAFTGTWKLNPHKSTSVAKEDEYTAGIRIYTPANDGQHVTYTMTHGDGNVTKGEYTVRCTAGHCTSDVARWTRKTNRSGDGETLSNGKVLQKFIRTVSDDGKTLTITFFAQNMKSKTSVQIWERQP